MIQTNRYKESNFPSKAYSEHRLQSGEPLVFTDFSRLAMRFLWLRLINKEALCHPEIEVFAQ
jgi:hypothetical protein